MFNTFMKNLLLFSLFFMLIFSLIVIATFHVSIIKDGYFEQIHVVGSCNYKTGAIFCHIDDMGF